MATRTIKLTHEQIEYARLTVEADQAAGRVTDPIIATIATVGSEPVTIEPLPTPEAAEAVTR